MTSSDHHTHEIVDQGFRDGYQDRDDGFPAAYGFEEGLGYYRSYPWGHEYLSNPVSIQYAQKYHEGYQRDR